MNQQDHLFFPKNPKTHHHENIKCLQNRHETSGNRDYRSKFISFNDHSGHSYIQKGAKYVHKLNLINMKIIADSLVIDERSGFVPPPIRPRLGAPWIRRWQRFDRIRFGDHWRAVDWWRHSFELDLETQLSMHWHSLASALVKPSPSSGASDAEARLCLEAWSSGETFWAGWVWARWYGRSPTKLPGGS